MERYQGRIEQAEVSLNTAITLNPRDTEAYELRSQLRTQHAHDNHVDELENLLSSGFSSWRDEVRICYALAKEYEDIEQYDSAFARLKRGADTRRKNMRYQVSRELETMAEIQSVFNADLFNKSVGGYSGEAPIFIIGLPRTGTTLVERILDSHSKITSAGELNNFAIELTRQAREKSGQRLGGTELVRLSATLDFTLLGRAYIDSVKSIVEGGAQFIDKLPMNFLYAGLIHLALPKAKIIHVTRHPMDTCYAMYKHLFKDAYPYSYNLVELGQYYLAYKQLTEHWMKVIPGCIYTLTYEKLVEDTEKEVQELLAYCEVPWESRCLRFYENTNVSTTASSVQVRQPIYHSSVQKWRHYKRQLRPLSDLFQSAGITVNT